MRITALALAMALALPTGLAAQEQKEGQPQVTPEQQAQLAPDANSLIGKKAAGPQGKDVGEIKDVLVGPDGRVQALVVDVKGKDRAVPWNQLSMQADQVTVKMDEQQLSQLPEYRGSGKD
jgi:sporulation protein YlmC with PRC-barrel domain